MAGTALSVLAGTAQADEILGRVTNVATGAALPGAVVRVAEIGRQVVTGRDGAFLLTNLPAGDYTLVVTYQGLDTQQIPVVVAPGGSIRQEIGLTSQTFAINQVVVVAQREGQAAAINLQRTAPSIRTVVSADALGQIREGNIGDALVRLPGLSVETRAGVQRTATIRGLAPQYNTVTVDGLRMTNVDGNRDIALDSFPSNMLARVEVVKSPTPDMSADAIGGTVNLITRSAFDSRQRIVEGMAGLTYNDLRGNWNRQAGVTLADTFGADRQFGVLGSLYYFRDERGYDVVDTAYTVSASNQYFINRSLYYDRAETKDKIGAGLVLDYRPSNRTSAYFRAIYHYDYRWLWRRGTDYRPNPATQFNVTPDQGSSTGGRIDSIVFYREPKNVFQMYTAGVEHRPGAWELDALVAYSKAEKTYPVTLQVLNSFNNVNLTYDRSNRDFPSFTVDNGVNITDPAGLAFGQFNTSQVPRTEDEWHIDSNVRRRFDAANLPWSLAGGFRASFKEAAQAQPLTVRYTGLQGVPVGSLLETYSNSDFMRESDGRGRLLGFFPDWRRYLELQQTNPAALTQTPAARLFTAQTIANADFSITENIYAGYAMATVDFNQLQLLGGVRVEKTEISSSANAVSVAGGQIVSIERVSRSSDYTSVLPGLQGRFTSADGRLVLRAAATKAISRPPPGDLVPSRQENAQLNQRIVGNPDLKPAESVNLDASAEYFFPPLGLLSVGVFHKDISNFVFSSSRIGADGVDERTRVNGEGGSATGLELAWIQQFTFLPGALSGLGVEANLTFLDSKGSYPGRDSDNLPLVNSPSYILNGIVSYARGPLGVRVSYNRLPKRLEAVGARAALDRYNAESSIWDLAVKFRVLENHSLFLNVKNIGNRPVVQYQGARENPTSVVYYGRQINFGLNVSF